MLVLLLIVNRILSSRCVRSRLRASRRHSPPWYMYRGGLSEGAEGRFEWGCFWVYNKLLTETPSCTRTATTTTDRHCGRALLRVCVPHKRLLRVCVPHKRLPCVCHTRHTHTHKRRLVSRGHECRDTDVTHTSVSDTNVTHTLVSVTHTLVSDTNVVDTHYV